MTDPNEWIGGQLTSQAVPPDEHPWIEQFGCTRAYRRFRDDVRDYYRRWYPLTPEARADKAFNPGGGWVSRLACEVIEAISALSAAARDCSAWTLAWRSTRIAWSEE